MTGPCSSLASNTLRTYKSGLRANKFLHGFYSPAERTPHNKALTNNGFKEDQNTPTTCLYLRDTYERVLLLKPLGILTLYTVLSAKMGSVELRTAAKLKDFIFLLVNGLLAGKTSKKEEYRRLPLPIHLYFFPLFPDHGHPSSKINEEHKNYIRCFNFLYE